MYAQLITSYIIIVQCQNQEIDMVPCVYSSVILSHVESCNHHCKQNIELFHHHKDPPCATPL